MEPGSRGKLDELVCSGHLISWHRSLRRTLRMQFIAEQNKSRNVDYNVSMVVHH